MKDSFASTRLIQTKQENVDRHTYQGSSVQVGPVDVSQNGTGAIEMHSFRDDIVKPDMLAQTMAAAAKDSGVTESPTLPIVSQG